MNKSICSTCGNENIKLETHCLSCGEYITDSKDSDEVHNRFYCKWIPKDGYGECKKEKPLSNKEKVVRVADMITIVMSLGLAFATITNQVKLTNIEGGILWILVATGSLLSLMNSRKVV